MTALLVANPDYVASVKRALACSALVTVGDFVYVDSASVIRRADITNRPGSRVVGVCIEKPTSTTCVIQFTGIVTGVFSGLTPGQKYSVGLSAELLAGRVTGQACYIVCAGVAVGSDEFLLQHETPVYVTG